MLRAPLEALHVDVCVIDEFDAVGFEEGDLFIRARRPARRTPPSPSDLLYDIMNELTGVGHWGSLLAKIEYNIIYDFTLAFCPSLC